MEYGDNRVTRSYRFIVDGRVQGVGFRQAVMGKALVLGLHGWVRNRDDGRVEGRVTGGDDAALEEFRAFLGIGPAAAKVTACDWAACELVDEQGFRVLR